MKKIFVIFMILSVAMLVLFSGCLQRITLPFLPDSAQEETPESEPAEVSEPENLEPESEADTAAPPDVAAESLLKSIGSLDRAQIDELVGQYFGAQELPEEYFSLLEPISERLTYEIGAYQIDGDTASVKVTVSTVDAQNAIDSVMNRAVIHLAAMQFTGKDVSNPEQILAEYAANNIKWDEIPAKTTDTTLYLIKGEDGEWIADAANPDNLDFANAISGGAIDVANNLKAYIERYK